MFYTFEAGNETYKLRLNTRNIVELEKLIGKNPLAIFDNGETLPPITEMVAILHCSLQQFQHSITLNKTYDIFDAYLADGKTASDFIGVIVEIYKASGIIADDSKEEESLKN